MIPRIVKRKAGVTDDADGPKASTSAESLPAQESSSTTAIETQPEPEQDDKQLLQSIASVVEQSLSDFGLSWHKDSNNDLAAKLRQSGDHSVHLQQFLQLQPVRALTDSIAILQRALSAASLSSLQLSDDKFRLVRTSEPDYDKIANTSQQDWLDSTVYLEHVPSLPGQPSTAQTLLPFFDKLFDTKVRRVILPILHDAAAAARKQASTKTHQDPTSQTSLFKKAISDAKDSKEAADRVLQAWPWHADDSKSAATPDEIQVPADDDADGSEAGNEHSEKELPLPDEHALARKWGMRSLSYSKFLQLEEEYLAFSAKLASLAERASNDNYNDNKRKRHNDSRYNRDDWNNDSDRSRPDPRTVEKWTKVERSPTPPKWQQNQNSRGRKRVYDHRDRDEDEEDSTKTMYVADEDQEVGAGFVAQQQPANLETSGTYPKGCVVWLRNVNPASNRLNIKSYISKLLEEQEEGTGTGVVYIQFEKGLDNAHVRFSSAHLSNLFIETIREKGPLYALPRSLTTEKPPSVMDEVEPIDPQLLTGEKETIYWASLPERARRGARMSAAGESELANVRAADLAVASSDTATTAATDNAKQDMSATDAGTEQEESSRKRKKPSKF